MDPITIGSIFNLGGALIDKLFPDPTERARAQAEMARLVQDGELKELETRMSAIIAEANSKDPWTSRARPAFLYVMYVMILAAIPMALVFAFAPEAGARIATGLGAWLNAIPDGMWATFGIGYSGYAIARSYDKKTVDGR